MILASLLISAGAMLAIGYAIALIPQLSEEDIAFTNIEDMLWSGYTAGGAWIYQGDWSVLPGYVQGWLAGEIE